MTVAAQPSIARGAAWMVLFKMAERSLGLISTLILVRVLAPTDFGIVAMAISFIAMAELLSAFGFDIALIHNQNASESHYHTAWTCNLVLGLLITTVMIAAAQPVASFYGRPEVFWVVVALGFGATLTGMENIGVVAFRKDLQFHREFMFLLSKKLAAVLITVPLAFWLRSYWALVIGTLSSRLFSTLLSYAVHPFRPRFSIVHMRELMGFSRWMLVSNVVIFFKERSTDFVIGSIQGPRALGLYNVSNELSQLPMTELAAPINRALIPSFARIQDDLGRVHAAFGNSIGWLAVALIPAAAGICAVAPHLVPVLLGPQWLDAVALMQVLSIAGGLIALHSPICALIIATGRPGRVAACHAFFVVVLITGLVLLVPKWASIGAAWAVLSAAALATPAYLFQLRRSVGYRLRDLLGVLIRPLLASLVMVFIIRMLVPPPAPVSDVLSNILLLLGAVAIGVVSYVLALGLLWLASGRPSGVESSATEYLRLAAARLSTRNS
jgi:O-antigen/teichoic acid export membrane protein